MHNSFYHRTLTSDQGLQRSRKVSLDRHYADLSFTEGASMVWRCPQRQECCDFPIYVRLLPQLISVHRQRHHQMIRGWVPLANPLSNLDPTIISMYFHRQLMLSTFCSQWHIRVLDLPINYHHGKIYLWDWSWKGSPTSCHSSERLSSPKDCHSAAAIPLSCRSHLWYCKYYPFY